MVSDEAIATGEMPNGTPRREGWRRRTKYTVLPFPDCRGGLPFPRAGLEGRFELVGPFPAAVPASADDMRGHWRRASTAQSSQLQAPPPPPPRVSTHTLLPLQ